MKLVIFSDIHANVTALNAIIKDIKKKNLKDYKIAILGDTINYGLSPNKTLEILKEQINIEILLAGNHEMALMGFEEHKFSTQRGKEILQLTKKLISKNNYQYIENSFTKDYVKKQIDGRLYLFIHGSLQDKFWGSINNENMNNPIYKKYDIVVSGHSHKPHYVEIFFEDVNKDMRNKKRTIFINPGSIGQPRNHSNQAQYSILDTKTLELSFCKCSYDIQKEQKIYDNYDVDIFYKTRLGVGL